MDHRQASERRNDLTLRLLKAYGTNPGERVQVPLADRDVEAIYTLGLHFLVSHAIESGTAKVSDNVLEVLESADLTARVVHGQLASVAEDVLTLSTELSIPVVLLKGIANAADLYIQPHHRTMGDVDVLVKPEHSETLYRKLLSHGYSPMYRNRGMIWADGYHHLHPLQHPASEIPVELHTALFSRASPELQRIFAPSYAWQATMDSDFRGQPCLRLTDEFDFVYAITHWASDLGRATNAIGICDIFRMLEIRGTDLDWEKIRHWLIKSPQLANFVTVVLDFFEVEGMAKSPIALKNEMTEAKERIGNVNLRALHFVLSAYSLTCRQRVAGVISREHADIVWNTILESGNRNGGLPAAVLRILNLRKQPDELLIFSLLRRLKRVLSSSR